MGSLRGALRKIIFISGHDVASFVINPFVSTVRSLIDKLIPLSHS